MQPMRSKSDALEAQTLAKFDAELRAHNLADKETKVSAQSDLGVQITTYVEEAIKDFPHTSNHSTFVHSTFTLCPKIVVDLSDLEMHYEIPGNPFSKVVAMTLQVQPLKSTRFGEITTKETHLELTNIRFGDNATFTENKWNQQSVDAESDLCLINGEGTFGEVDIDPTLKITHLYASVRFGEFEAEDQEIEVEIRNREVTDQELSDDETTELIISLSQLNLSGKIEHDGSVTLDEKHKTFNLEEILDKPVQWVDIDFEYDLQLCVKQEK